MMASRACHGCSSALPLGCRGNRCYCDACQVEKRKEYNATYEREKRRRLSGRPATPKQCELCNAILATSSHPNTRYCPDCGKLKQREISRQVQSRYRHSERGARLRREYKGRGDVRERERLQAAAPQRRRKSREANNKCNLRLKLSCLEAYGGPHCKLCGCSQISLLTLHHTNGDGGVHRASFGIKSGGVRFYRHLRDAGFPVDREMVVLCKACHYGHRPTAGSTPCAANYAQSDFLLYGPTWKEGA